MFQRFFATLLAVMACSATLYASAGLDENQIARNALRGVAPDLSDKISDAVARSYVEKSSSLRAGGRQVHDFWVLMASMMDVSRLESN